MGREFELKFQADGEKIAAIAAQYGDFNRIAMETTYYDTFDMKLGMHHWTLRRRMENGVSVCTFKRPLEDGSRAEWEVEAGNIMSGTMQLCQAGAPWELMRVTAGGVQPICGARFTRLAKTLTLENCTVELALDQGVLKGGGREQPFAEVEVELKEGDQQEAETFAMQLASRFGLTREGQSKHRRAMLLAFGG